MTRSFQASRKRGDLEQAVWLALVSRFSAQLRAWPGLAAREGEFPNWLRLARWELPGGRRTGNGMNKPTGTVLFCYPTIPLPPTSDLQRAGVGGKECFLPLAENQVGSTQVKLS